jgi:hypothetical protein
METETMLRIGAIAVGVLILLSSYGDVTGLVGRLLSFVKKPTTPTPVNPKPVVVEPVVTEEEQFLHIIDLWHQLRTECADYGLPKAVSAIDGVFPLLNDRTVDEKVEVVKKVVEVTTND